MKIVFNSIVATIVSFVLFVSVAIAQSPYQVLLKNTDRVFEVENVFFEIKEKRNNALVTVFYSCESCPSYEKMIGLNTKVFMGIGAKRQSAAMTDFKVGDIYFVSFATYRSKSEFLKSVVIQQKVNGTLFDKRGLPILNLVE